MLSVPAHAAGDYQLQILESHRITAIGDRNSIAWLDNDRVLVAGYDPALAAKLGLPKDGYIEQPALSPNLYEWDVRTDEMRAVYDLAYPQFCLNGDLYTYSRMWRGGQLLERQGTVGQEVVRPYVPKREFSWLLCRERAPSEERPAQRGGGTRSLLPGHGYLEIGVDRVNRAPINPLPKNLWHYPRKGHPGFELPIPSKEAGFFLWFRYST